MLRTQVITTETILVATTIGLVTVLGFYWYKKKTRYAVPTKWEPVGKVKNLYIYPLKSGHRNELQTALCTDYGIRMPRSDSSYQFYDRNLLVYNGDDNEFRTARQYPKLLFIKVHPHPTEENYFTLDAPEMPTIKIKIPTPNENEEGEITLHKGEKIFRIDCGDAAAKWISNYILGSDSGLRLGYHDTFHRRNINDSYKKYLEIYPRFRNEATGMYTECTSYLIMNQASVDELNSRIPDADITVHNFRPNILIDGENATPYAEDNWDWMKIGDVVLYFAKPCTRCLLTTINPETGIKSETSEPLKTLRTYRLLKFIKDNDLEGNLPVIGNHMGLHTGGEISVGDIVYVGKG